MHTHSLDKRAFLIGYFVGVVEHRDGEAVQSNVNILCDMMNMTPLSLQEADDLARFMDYAGEIMEKNARAKGKMKN